jgi:hypothetical protein
MSVCLFYIILLGEHIIPMKADSYEQVSITDNIIDTNCYQTNYIKTHQWIRYKLMQTSPLSYYLLFFMFLYYFYLLIIILTVYIGCFLGI